MMQSPSPARGAPWLAPALERTLLTGLLLLALVADSAPAAGAARCGEAIGSMARTGYTNGPAGPAVLASDSADLAFAAFGRQVFTIRPNWSSGRQPVTSCGAEVPGAVQRLASAGDGYLYAAYSYISTAPDGDCGIAVIDSSTPDHLRFLGAVPLGIAAAHCTERIAGMAVSPPFLLVATGSALMKLDISDPVHPAEVGRFAPSDWPFWSFATSGSLAYLTDRNLLWALDVSDPEGSITRLSTTVLDDPYDIAVAGSIVYVSAATRELTIVDVSDPSEPAIVGSVDAVGRTGQYSTTALDVTGDVLLVETLSDDSGHRDGITRLDISDPRSPRLAGFVETYDSLGCCGADFDAQGGVAVLVMGASLSNIMMSDARGSSGVSLSASLPLVDSAVDIAMVQGYAVLGDQWSGLHLVDLSDLHEPATLEIVNPRWPAASGYPAVGSLAVRDPWVFTAALEEGLNVTRVRSGGSFDAHVRVPPVEASNDVAVDGDTLLVADEAGWLLVYDVEHPYTPIEVSRVAMPGPAQRVAFAPPIAVVGAGTWDASALVVVDLSDPSSPSVASQVEVDEIVSDLDIEGPLVAASMNRAGVVFVDITAPGQPQVRSQLDLGHWALSVQLRQSVAWVGTYSYGGLMAVDLRDPAQPHVVETSASLANADAIDLHGRYALVAGEGSGGLILDLTECEMPGARGPRDGSGRVGP